MAGHDDAEVKIETVKAAVGEMKLEPKSPTESIAPNGISNTTTPKEEVNGHVSLTKSSTPSLKPSKSRSRSAAAAVKDEPTEEKVGGEITVKQEPGQPPKLARSASQKMAPRVAPVFTDFPDKTEEATSTFQVMEACTYANKYMGYTEHAMDCDCVEEWGKSLPKEAIPQAATSTSPHLSRLMSPLLFCSAQFKFPLRLDISY